jgi:uncharacterized membrane protein
MLETIISIIAVIAFLVVPGFIWSYVFFPGKRNQLINAAKDGVTMSSVTRLIISICLSLALVSISLFYLDYLFGLRPSALAGAISIAGTSLFGIIVLIFTSPELIRQCIKTLMHLLKCAIKEVSR